MFHCYYDLEGLLTSLFLDAILSVMLIEVIYTSN